MLLTIGKLYDIIYAVDKIRWDWRSWLARQVVALKAVGSNPISHPMKKAHLLCRCAFFSYIRLRRVLCTLCVILPSAVV